MTRPERKPQIRFELCEGDPSGYGPFSIDAESWVAASDEELAAIWAWANAVTPAWRDWYRRGGTSA